MCGISGIYNFNYENKVNRAVIEKMTESIIHRGPDDVGIVVEDNYGLGFCRLSIIDLMHGAQPISNEDGSVLLVCNGEIFNYKLLSEKLRNKGHSFKTGTDIEVILHLYEEKGMQLLDELNGQFAFAIIDRNKRKSFIARDHMGILPIFYHVDNERFAFASEIKALLSLSNVARNVDMISLDQYLSLPACVSPRTMFENIKSVCPGSYVEISTGTNKIVERKYWDISFPKDGDHCKNEDISYYTKKIEELLLKSVELRLQADVKVGAFLSGGLDSSLITCMLKNLTEKEIELFSITFEDHLFDESKYQNIVAEKVGYRKNNVHFKTSDILNRMEKVIYHSEAPVKETYNTATIALSENVRKRDIKVVLSGEGSDELFAGYPSYRYDLFRRIRNQKSTASEKEQSLSKKVWGDSNFKYELNLSLEDSIKSKILNKNVLDKYKSYDFTEHGVVDIDTLEGVHPVDRRSYLDLKVRLADHLLSDHSDRMLMANSVEGRFPFLDIELVKFASSIPPELKLNNFQEKFILKHTAKGIVPQEIVDREKFVFASPGSPYFLQSNSEWVCDLLSYDRIKRQGYFDADEIERLKNIYKEPGFVLNTPIEQDQLLYVITFCLFLDVFNVSNY